MLRAHRQAWCWQDEYQGLTLEDIRKLEQETQEALRQKMAAVTATEGDSAENGSTSPKLPAVVSVVTTPSEQSSNDNVSNNAVSENKRKSNDLTGLNGKDRIDEVKRNENRCSLMRDPSLGSFASAVTSRRLSWESAHSGLSGRFIIMIIMTMYKSNFSFEPPTDLWPIDYINLINHISLLNGQKLSIPIV